MNAVRQIRKRTQARQRRAAVHRGLPRAMDRFGDGLANAASASRAMEDALRAIARNLLQTAVRSVLQGMTEALAKARAEPLKPKEAHGIPRT